MRPTGTVSGAEDDDAPSDAAEAEAVKQVPDGDSRFFCPRAPRARETCAAPADVPPPKQKAGDAGSSDTGEPKLKGACASGSLKEKGDDVAAATSAAAAGPANSAKGFG